MSRVLAEILGANELSFRLQLQQLERAAGAPGADIRLAVHIANETRSKVRQLGLDQTNTTGPELYAALKERLRQDETRVRATLGILDETDTATLLEHVRHFIAQQDQQSKIFAVKHTALRAILKKLKPKATMKALGYRSMDSMLKHEAVPQLLAATLICESVEWHRHRLDEYKKLQAKDFESRPVQFLLPTAKLWPKLSARYSDEHKHNIMPIAESGAVVILPLEHDMPGLAVTTFLLISQAVNDIRSFSTYLKLQQVRPDFGAVVRDSVMSEPITEAELAGEQLPWKIVHWFYGQGHATYHPDAFEPHVQPEDLGWHDAEALLADVHPAMEFWQGSHLLAMLDGSEPVSLNALDVALSVCNNLNYGERVLHHVRSSLSRELFGRYLHQENLQVLLASTLGRQLEPGLEFDLD